LKKCDGQTHRTLKRPQEIAFDTNKGQVSDPPLVCFRAGQAVIAADIHICFKYSAKPTLICLKNCSQLISRIVQDLVGGLR
jgi:hypothetical protein